MATRGRLTRRAPGSAEAEAPLYAGPLRRGRALAGDQPPLRAELRPEPLDRRGGLAHQIEFGGDEPAQYAPVEPLVIVKVLPSSPVITGRVMCCVDRANTLRSISTNV